MGFLCHRSQHGDIAPLFGALASTVPSLGRAAGKRLARFVLVVSALALLGAPAVAQPADQPAAKPATKPATKPVQKVLGLRVESFDLSDKDKEDLFKVVQQRLEKYESIELVSPPDAELTDLMIDLGCLDIDVDCLTKVGRKRMADRVFYVQVDAAEAGFVLTVRLIDVTRGNAERDRKVEAGSQAQLSTMLESEIVRAFGEPPPPPVKEGLLVIETDAGARIYIDTQFAGSGQLSLSKPPGLYVVRISKPGFEDALFRVDLQAGQTARKVAQLKPVAIAAPPPVVPTPEPEAEDEIADTEADDGPAFYETWWFWTAVGAVVVTGTTVGLVLGIEPPSKPTGTATFSNDESTVFRDIGIREQCCARAR